MRDTRRSMALWLTTAFRAAPGLVALQCLLQIVQSALAPAQAYGVALMINGALTGTGVRWGTAVVLTALAANFLIEAVLEPLASSTYERIHGRLHADLLTLTGSIDGLEHLERPGVADRLQQLGTETWRLSRSARTLVSAAGTAAGTATLLWLLAGIHPLLLALPLLGVVRVVAASAGGKLLWQATERTSGQRRLVERLLELAGEARHGLEVRALGVSRLVLDRIGTLLRQVATVEREANRRGTAREVLAGLIFGAGYVAAILFVIHRVRQGLLQPGDVVLIILLAGQVDQAATGLATSARELGQLLSMFHGYVVLHDYVAGIAVRAGTAAPPDRPYRAMRLDRVSFRYDGTDRDVLTDVTLEVPAGSVIALVGDNGAGKSTLIKLLLGLYEPTRGRILIGGRNLRDIDVRQWWAVTAAGFQDFCRFEFTARETVGVGDLRRADDDEAIAAALRLGDATGLVARLPAGLDTQLGKHFADGVELSGGQWQRLALARAFLRTHPALLVLDEPTSALDPAAEFALFSRFVAAARDTARAGGIGVLVSHRFSTVRMADLIAVFAAGRLIEFGTHEELLSRGGHYADLFALQARAYR